MTSENPYEAKRRWRLPRFKLSTILVLVSILAWAMSLKPFFSCESFTADPRIDRAGMYVNIGLENWEDTPYLLFRIGPTPELAGPLLALAAFLTWKLGWSVAARRKRRREAAV